MPGHGSLLPGYTEARRGEAKRDKLRVPTSEGRVGALQVSESLHAPTSEGRVGACIAGVGVPPCPNVRGTRWGMHCRCRSPSMPQRSRDALGHALQVSESLHAPTLEGRVGACIAGVGVPPVLGATKGTYVPRPCPMSWLWVSQGTVAVWRKCLGKESTTWVILRPCLTHR